MAIPLHVILDVLAFKVIFVEVVKVIQLPVPVITDAPSVRVLVLLLLELIDVAEIVWPLVFNVPFVSVIELFVVVASWSVNVPLGPLKVIDWVNVLVPVVILTAERAAKVVPNVPEIVMPEIRVRPP